MSPISLADDDDDLTWQDRWERSAMAERANFSAMSADELVAFVQSGRVGSYYNLWYVISEKCSLSQVGRLLIEIIEQSPDELVRYHALSALGQMLGLAEDDEYRHASLVRDFPVDRVRLEPLKALLEKKLTA